MATNNLILKKINFFNDQYKTINKDFNCFTYNLSDFAASYISSRGNKKKLSGKLIAIKDNINIKGYPTTCASEMLNNNYSLYNATVIDSILKEDGAIVAKTNMDEFAMGSSNEHSVFGSSSNPVNIKKVTGGSSGGSAAAVACGSVDISLGSDTGGSVRQPAAFCGVYGFKPTYGRISRYGLIAFASSLDQIGIFANNTEDTANMFSVIGGHDPKDSNTSKIALSCDYKSINSNKMRVGYSTNLLNTLDKPIRNQCYKLIEFLKSNNVIMVDIDIDISILDLAIPTYYIIATAEASSNLARFDGVRYGSRYKNNNLDDMFFNTKSYLFGDEVKRRIMLGTYVLSSGYYDAYYSKALKVRRIITNHLINYLSDLDVLILPTAPSTAFDKGEKLNNSLDMYLSDIFTIPISLAGLPAMNIPIGYEQGLPIGAQLCANYFQENKIFALSNFIEKNIN